jgi:hypothetical protein
MAYLTGGRDLSPPPDCLRAKCALAWRDHNSPFELPPIDRITCLLAKSKNSTMPCAVANPGGWIAATLKLVFLRQQLLITGGATFKDISGAGCLQ